MRAFVSTADNTYKKVRASDGRIMRFKDGTPITQNAWNAAQQHIEYLGEPVDIAVPSDQGPGYERVELDPDTASSFGGDLYRYWEGEERRIRSQTLIVEGEEYDLDELAELNERIIARHGSDAVFQYA